MPEFPKPLTFDRVTTEDISSRITDTDTGAIPTAIRPSTEKENDHQIGKKPGRSNNMVIEKRGPCQIGNQNPNGGDEKDENRDPPVAGPRRT